MPDVLREWLTDNFRIEDDAVLIKADAYKLYRGWYNSASPRARPRNMDAPCVFSKRFLATFRQWNCEGSNRAIRLTGCYQGVSMAKVEQAIGRSGGASVSEEGTAEAGRMEEDPNGRQHEDTEGDDGVWSKFWTGSITSHPHHREQPLGALYVDAPQRDGAG